MALSSEVASVRKTALNAVHRQMGAKMVEFNGWDMPVEYPKAGGLVAEHMAVRNSVGTWATSGLPVRRLCRRFRR
jgi:aminomethyltransferase